MSSLTVWKFESTDGAQEALDALADLQRQQLIQVLDAAVVSWEVGKNKPKTRELRDTKKAGALGGGFWGLLFGLIFFIPILGLAIGAATGALIGSMADVGISDSFIRDVREKVTPGYVGPLPAQFGRRHRPGHRSLQERRGRADQHQSVQRPGSEAPGGVQRGGVAVAEGQLVRIPPRRA